MKDIYDVIIIGAGACGLFTAINMAEIAPKKKILILEKGKEALGKVRISGGGRCNLTNAQENIHEFIKNYPRGSRELLSSFSRFSNKDTINWFKQHGVSLKEEVGGRIFPLSNSSLTVINCFLSLAEKYGIQILYKQNVTAFSYQERLWEVTLSDTSLHAKHLVITTGSNPKVWQLLSHLGHTIIPPVPSLFTFATKDSFIENLAGISTRVTVKLLDSNYHPLKASYVEKQGVTGDLLITHWGFSGPAILKLSSFFSRILALLNYTFLIQVNWLVEEEHTLSFSEALIILQKEKQKHARKELQNYCPFHLANKLWNRLLDNIRIPAHQLWAELNKEQLHSLADTLTASIFHISNRATFKEEFVTSGGVCLKEIDFKSFRSKLFPSLYLGGEVLDIDAITGGFNFQNAWTGGYLIAQAMACELR
ncbi:NAD(P)/FAD-dependent oxidoreductase [Capnocytophaga sp. oral taxon 338]|uniref:NAD(P)/FAD-dependent oxidoreductase n=1 Tax=Capnocytophaga sp. oral taxon 338 TaxID=710239 RepID=UPI000202F179|nr:pyridine nucleotide-disulfide oxidoreductase [Capnocytophaga sp. oral taxon 338 str. F0234]